MSCLCVISFCGQILQRLFILAFVTHSVIGKEITVFENVRIGRGCKGLLEKQLDGTICNVWGFIVDCGGSFPPGTNLYFKCEESYIPSLLNTSDENHGHWQETRCLNNQWSNSEFQSFRCAKESNWYCSEGWVSAGSTYNGVHFQVMMVMYVLGFTTNIVNLAVLTRKSMRNPLNTILASLAFTDFIFILNGLVTEALRLYRADHGDSRSSYQLIVEWLINQVAYYLFHTWSIYLTLLVAIWRCVGIWYPLQSRRWCVAKTAKLAIFAVILFGIILLGTIHGGTRIERVEEISAEVGNPQYRLVQSELSTKLLFWTYAIFVKLVPCTFLTFFTLGLIWGLMKAKQNRIRLSESRMHLRNVQIEESKADYMETTTVDADIGKLEFDRTTKMLLVILIIFLVTEIPDGVLSILYLLLSPRFTQECLYPSTNFCSLLEQMSCVLSMFIYLAMSQAYRDTLIQILKKS